MRKVFWDTMLFIYLLEENALYFPQVEVLLARSQQRGDLLYTSALAVGEVLAGLGEQSSARSQHVEAALRALRFRVLAFDERCIPFFRELRSSRRVKAADAIHLSCAGAEGMDLFVTHDQALHRLDVPGVKFMVTPEQAQRVL